MNPINFPKLITPVTATTPSNLTTTLATTTALITSLSHRCHSPVIDPPLLSPLENVDYQSSGRLCNLRFLEYFKLYFFQYEHVAVNSTRHGLDTATIGKPASLEFKRISLTGFRSCTSRSRYRSVSKQTTRSVDVLMSKEFSNTPNSFIFSNSSVNSYTEPILIFSCHKFDSYRIAQVTCRSACLMLALVGFPSSL
ncbi:hypothetical protein Tco_1211492 [Tanacetum coccineum]